MCSGEGQRLKRLVREEGMQTWNKASDEVKEYRRLAVAVFDNLSYNVSLEEQQRRSEAGTEVCADAFASLSPDSQDALRQLGRENCHLGAAGGNKA